MCKTLCIYTYYKLIALTMGLLLPLGFVRENGRQDQSNFSVS